MQPDLGMAIRRRRKKLGISQRCVSERSGVERSHVTRIEGGKWTPRLETLERIAAALETTSAVLLSAKGLKRAAV
jgi:predicted transcriptional regulator